MMNRVAFSSQFLSFSIFFDDFMIFLVLQLLSFFRRMGLGLGYSGVGLVIHLPAIGSTRGLS